VVFRVRLGRLFGVILGVDVVRVGEMSLMAGVYVLAFPMMFGGLAMMLGSLLVMLGSLLVMLGGFLVMLGGAFRVLHNPSPRCAPASARGDYARIGRRTCEAFMSY
jgi:hypothetical protein